MNHVTIASSEADARAAEAVELHHAEMAGKLAIKVDALTTLARSGHSDDLPGLRDDLVAWGRDELLPHARAEESTLYLAAAARPEGRLLVEAMLADHGTIGTLVDDLAQAVDPVDAAVAAGALRVAFAMHVAKENEQVLPMLVAAPDVSVADLLARMHELAGGRDEHHHECTCAEVDPLSWPELDARGIPHAIRHATIFGALDTVLTGRGMVLVAPHDPLPLLDQLKEREPGAFEVTYLEQGPQTWRLSLERVSR